MENGTKSHGKPFLFMIFLRWQFWNVFFESAIIIIYLFMAAEASVAAAYGWLMKDKLIDEKHFRASGLRIDWKR